MPRDTLQESARYLERLGYAAPPPPTLATLAELQARHTRVFPFETLSCLLRQPVPIDLPALEEKILHDGRGGYCYELNLLYQALLRHLGYTVRAISGRVVMGGPEDAWTARSHLLALVTVDGDDYISDVGFGRLVPTVPLRLEDRQPQPTPLETFQIGVQDDGYMLRAQVNGVWRALYRFDTQRQEAVDFEMGNWYVSTHPDSPLLGQLVVARCGDGHRKTLNNGSYGVHRPGAISERRQLTDADAVLALLRDEFDLALPAHPELRTAIARRLAPSATR
ncbi:arylamine N-acetyltransferase [Bordetella genomosp. 11]|uniref:Arylamine N-acetyltransferase n=2 Tax=Bordetella genomosp. 11 TaxID=1416808 RepID=A0A261UFA4_9BORD|nr:arylamine N-acetyltransferase [Bordetella genomosp. 11]